MRICSPQLGLAPNSILGGEVFDREILLGLAKKGVEVEIILPKNLPHDKKVKNWNITFLPIAHFPAVLFNLILIPYLFVVSSKRPFNILRLHQPQFTWLAAVVFKFFNPKVKVLANYHKFEETKMSPFSRWLNHSFDHIICDSENVKRLIVKKYEISKSKITVVHNGVPNYLKPKSKDQLLVKKLNLKNKNVLLFMGLFIKRKNPTFLLHVLHELSKRDRDYLLLFWGTGPLKNDLVKLSKELNIYSKIIFINPIFGPKKNKIHNLADVFVHPSLDEGLALAPLEAMACAKPIIITDGYSAREVVEEGKNGYLAKASDIKDWTNKIWVLTHNKKINQNMSKYALKKVIKDFNWRKSTQMNLEIVKKLAQA